MRQLLATLILFGCAAGQARAQRKIAGGTIDSIDLATSTVRIAPESTNPKAGLISLSIDDKTAIVVDRKPGTIKSLAVKDRISVAYDATTNVAIKMQVVAHGDSDRGEKDRLEQKERDRKEQERIALAKAARDRDEAEKAARVKSGQERVEQEEPEKTKPQPTTDKDKDKDKFAHADAASKTAKAGPDDKDSRLLRIVIFGGAGFVLMAAGVIFFKKLRQRAKNPDGPSARDAKPALLLTMLGFYVLPAVLFIIAGFELWDSRKTAAAVCFSGALCSTVFGLLHFAIYGKRRKRDHALPPIIWPCPICSREVAAEGDQAGARTECPHCRSVMRVPVMRTFADDD
jgi:DNA-directed RNA polymerase subunit RPC12/RpoP